MRSYDVAIASLAIQAPRKWTDNILSQHAVPGVTLAHRGIARRISYQGLVRLAVTRDLHAELGLSVAGALAIADELLDPNGRGVLSKGHFHLALDLPNLERALRARLADALESAPRLRRGRPPVQNGM